MVNRTVVVPESSPGVVTLEEPIPKVDADWPATRLVSVPEVVRLALVEMKSAGEDLDKAYTQATEYFHGLKNEELPRSVLVSDFQNLHLYNLETHAEPVKIKLDD